ncbi:hypothetical protein CsatB_027056 [Cannabis sativa]|uniref:EF-hand domain-containing protein n=2 Tax=Cannabis sativa TaxID=3483 RepID=A0A7J6GGG5_CANSA|nr:hypothetical protein G4B88_016725 [Cannabis sativa]KAF4373050.1 hypothetical protein G4B88_008843 [Cannabis sativa]KAF4381948.1 hypothetical protein F8388_000642 [Cannabis sativa]
MGDVERIFKELDIDKDGQISIKELGEALQKLGSVTEEDVRRIMSEIDTDSNGSISFKEFSDFAHANAGLINDVAKIF